MNKNFIVGLAFLTLVGGAQAAGIRKDVRFATGTHGAQYTGQIKGYDYDSYVFYARAGQKLSANLDAGALDVVLFHGNFKDSVNLSPNSPSLDVAGQYTLPYGGRYELRVLQSRNDARSGQVVPYHLGIQIR